MLDVCSVRLPSVGPGRRPRRSPREVATGQGKSAPHSGRKGGAPGHSPRGMFAPVCWTNPDPERPLTGSARGVLVDQVGMGVQKRVDRLLAERLEHVVRVWLQLFTDVLLLRVVRAGARCADHLDVV